MGLCVMIATNQQAKPNEITEFPANYKPHKGQAFIERQVEARAKQLEFRNLRLMLNNHAQWGKTKYSAFRLLKNGIRLYDWRQREIKKNPKLKAILLPLVHQLYVGPDHPRTMQARREFINMIPDCVEYNAPETSNIIGIFPYKRADGKITYRWIIVFKTGENPEKIVAENYDDVVIEEARGMKAQVHKNVMSRIRNIYRTNNLYIIGTPGSELDPNEPWLTDETGSKKPNYHWQYLLWKDAEAGLNEYLVFKIDAYSEYRNPYTYPDDEAVERAKKEMDYETFRRDCLAEFIPFMGGIPNTPEYAKGEHFRDIADRYRPDRTLYICWDTGSTSPAMSVHQLDDSKWYQLGEFIGEDEPILVFGRRALDYVFSQWGDIKTIEAWSGTFASHNRGPRDNESEADVLTELFRERGFNLRVNLVREDEKSIRKALDIQRSRFRMRHTDGEPLAMVDVSCTATNAALSGGWHRAKDKFFKDGTPKPEKDGNYDGIADTRQILAMSRVMDAMGRIKTSPDFEDNAPKRTSDWW